MAVSRKQARRLIERWYAAALAAVDPAAAVHRRLARDGSLLSVDGKQLPLAGRLVVIAVGKAAVPMARAAEAVAGDLIADGIVITKDGHVTGPPLARLRVFEAAHPVPDQRGVAATRQALDLLAGLGEGDVVLAMISGGGSALLEAPRPPVTLADLAATTDLLLRAGAPIEHLNAVRTPLSLVKGGGLRRAAGGATVVTLILSDVLGNDPRVIASGPTVPRPLEPDQALALLDTYEVRGNVPRTVIDALTALPSEPGARSAPSSTDIVVVGDNDTAVRAAAEAAATDGFRVEVVWHERSGEAADLGRSWVEACRRIDSATNVVLGGGEATVRVRGDGLGGRNTEFALAAAIALDQASDREWVIASLATDGEDGPTDVAGAIADGRTVERAVGTGVDPVVALSRNDSLRAFAAAGGVVQPGPTGTNVNDLYFGVRTDSR